MGLKWAGQVGNLVATGCRGVYTIQSTTLGVHILQGVGHDELPMMDLPPFGAVFRGLDQAKEAAAELDRRPSTESQMSGT